MTIDMHAHWVPPALSAELRARKLPPHIVRTESGEEMLDNGGKRLIRLPEGFDDTLAALMSLRRGRYMCLYRLRACCLKWYDI